MALENLRIGIAPILTFYIYIYIYIYSDTGEIENNFLK